MPVLREVAKIHPVPISVWNQRYERLLTEVDPHFETDRDIKDITYVIGDLETSIELRSRKFSFRTAWSYRQESL